MPEPNYAGGDPPGPLVMVIGLAAIIIVALILRSCM